MRGAPQEQQQQPLTVPQDERVAESAASVSKDNTDTTIFSSAGQITTAPPAEANNGGISTKTGHARQMELMSQFDGPEEVKKRKRHVIVLYVGGTLGMCLNEKRALEPRKGFLTEEMLQMQELKDPGMPSFSIVEYENLVDSSDMGPDDWVGIAKDIERRYYDCDGFLVAHGTDTMHYTACALSFLLHNLSKPVIITGAMVSFAEPYNDARRNLIVSMMFAASPDIHEVCLFSNDVLLRGNRAIKARHTIAAFASPNYPPLARMEANQFSLNKKVLIPTPTGPLSISSNMKAKVLTLFFHMDFDVEAVFALLPRPSGAPPAGSAEAQALKESNGPETASKQMLDAIVIETSGFGSNESSHTKALLELAERANDCSSVVVISNIDIHGPMHSNAMVRIEKLLPGCICIHDMTTEALVVKLMYLFGRGMDPELVKEYIPKNIRGEVTPAVASSHL